MRPLVACTDISESLRTPCQFPLAFLVPHHESFENPEEDLVKANLIAEISHLIKKKKLTQVQVAKILGVTQPRVSSLLSGNLDLFSFEMLMHFLKALGQDVAIVIKPKPSRRKQAHLSVVTSSERISVPMAANSN